MKSGLLISLETVLLSSHGSSESFYHSSVEVDSSGLRIHVEVFSVDRGCGVVELLEVNVLLVLLIRVIVNRSFNLVQIMVLVLVVVNDEIGI